MSDKTRYEMYGCILSSDPNMLTVQCKTFDGIVFTAKFFPKADAGATYQFLHDTFPDCDYIAFIEHEGKRSDGVPLAPVVKYFKQKL